MNWKYLLAVAAYVVPSMLLALPWHLVWFRQAYHDFGIYTRPEPLVPLGLLSMLIQGIVLACLYPRFYRGGSPVGAGIRFGLLLGAFLYSISTLATIAKTLVADPGRFLLLSAAFHTLQFVIAGAAIGLVFGRLQPRSA